jgi:hypothetical protein
MGADFCFNVYDGKRALMVSAPSQSEKVQWMEDIVETVQVTLMARWLAHQVVFQQSRVRMLHFPNARQTVSLAAGNGTVS